MGPTFVLVPQKNIGKILYRRVSQKRYNFAPDAAIITLFFDSPCIYIYIYRVNLVLVLNHPMKSGTMILGIVLENKLANPNS